MTRGLIPRNYGTDEVFYSYFSVGHNVGQVRNLKENSGLIRTSVIMDYDGGGLNFRVREKRSSRIFCPVTGLYGVQDTVEDIL